MIEMVERQNIDNILGHGDIATALKEANRPDLFFFASGVANSQETRESEYKREIDLLLSQDKSRHLVYFTSLCTITEPNTRYSWHKIHMEQLVRQNFFRHTIMRLGNATWGSNPHHLFNFLRSHIESGEPFEVRDEYRHPFTKEDLLYWVNLIPDNRSCEIMVTGRPMKVRDIIEEIKAGKL